MLPWPAPKGAAKHYGLTQCPGCKDGRPLLLDEQQNKLFTVMEMVIGIPPTTMLMAFDCVDCRWQGVGKIDGEIET
jgi:hypothetical protein